MKKVYERKIDDSISWHPHESFWENPPCRVGRVEISHGGLLDFHPVLFESVLNNLDITIYRGEYDQDRCVFKYLFTCPHIAEVQWGEAIPLYNIFMRVTREEDTETFFARLEKVSETELTLGELSTLIKTGAPTW